MLVRQLERSPRVLAQYASSSVCFEVGSQKESMVIVSIQKIEYSRVTAEIKKVRRLIDNAKPSASFVGKRLYPCGARACAANILDRIADRHAFRVARAYFGKPHAVKLQILALYCPFNDSTSTGRLEGIAELQDSREVILIIDTEMDIRIVDDRL